MSDFGGSSSRGSGKKYFLYMRDIDLTKNTIKNISKNEPKVDEERNSH